MTVIYPPIETDYVALAQDAYDYMSANYPDWTPSDAQLDTWLLSANARMAATMRDVASDVPIAIFRFFGPLVGIPPIDESFATGLINLALSDNPSGRTFPQGANIGIPDAYGNLLGFKTLADTLIPAGNLTPAGIAVEANEAGSSYSGLGAAGVAVEVLDGFSWINGATLQGATSGGVDAETDEAYLSRLAENLRLMGPHPILPFDFSTMARNISGVQRALALDGYNPATATFGNERMITLAMVDEAGNPVSSAIKTAVQTYLAGMREVTFVINVIDPTTTVIDVQADVDAWPDQLPGLDSRVSDGIGLYLNPATWGQPPFGSDESNYWYSLPSVKIDNVIAAVGRVPGVKNVNSVLIRKGIDPYAAADIVLPGAAALAKLGVATTTVH